MLILNHIRDRYTADSTFGMLYFQGQRFCYTLEDTVRPPSIKVAGHTAIPEGVYDVDITHSSRFDRDMVLLYNRPQGEIVRHGIQFAGIRVHGGNTDEDTAGCILVGMNRSIGENRIWGSTEASVCNIVKNGLKDRVLWVVSSTEHE